MHRGTFPGSRAPEPRPLPTLVLLAHPALHKSRVHRVLAPAVHDLPGATLRDLYAAYPDFDVDVRREQELLLAHDTIVLQFPMYWYSTPALLKQWEDLVLEHGWAYGSEGRALEGKTMALALTTGGQDEAYTREGFHGTTLAEFLRPLERTAWLCRMRWHVPFVVHGTHRLDDAGIADAAARYRGWLAAIPATAPA